MTSSVEGAFGAGIMTGGFFLNNQLNDFNFEARDSDGKSLINSPGAGKQPRSSMAPTIIFNDRGQPTLALGSPGGSRIIPYVTQTIWLHLDRGISLAAAIATGRFAHVNQGHLELEQAVQWPASLNRQLTARGHQLRLRYLGSGLHAVAIDRNGMLTGIADPRREGTAVGR